MILPAIDFTHYVSKAFAILDTAIFLIRDSTLCDRYVAARVLRLNDCAASFLCDEHQVIGVKFINRVVTNIYLNNEQKQFSDEIRKNSIKDFKSRQKKIEAELGELINAKLIISIVYSSFIIRFLFIVLYLINIIEMLFLRNIFVLRYIFMLIESLQILIFYY